MFLYYNDSLVDESSFQINFTNNLREGKFAKQKFLFQNSKLYFAEESYFNLMVTMRKLRMEIPKHFTLEFFEREIVSLTRKNNLTESCVSITVIDKDFIITTEVQNNDYQPLVIDIYREIPVSTSYLHIQPIISPELAVAKVYAHENNLDDVILLNTDKKIAKTILGNLYAIKDNTIYSIPQEDGAYNQAIDKYLQHYITSKTSYTLLKKSLSPFELQNMDEVFLTVEGVGIKHIKQLGKKNFIFFNFRLNLNISAFFVMIYTLLCFYHITNKV